MLWKAAAAFCEGPSTRRLLKIHIHEQNPKERQCSELGGKAGKDSASCEMWKLKVLFERGRPKSIFVPSLLEAWG